VVAQRALDQQALRGDPHPTVAQQLAQVHVLRLP
jgi:hypothetical protein